MALRHHRNHTRRQHRHHHRNHRFTVPVHRARRALAHAIGGGPPVGHHPPRTAPGSAADAPPCKAERH
jgi:hypothetical protein